MSTTDMDHEELLQIGVFSTLSRISVRMLRHYQERGVLVPELIDPASGYRFYTAAQLPSAHLVTGLRDAGFGVEAIREFLAGLADPTRTTTELDAQRQRLLQAHAGVSAQLKVLDRIRTALLEVPMSLTVDRLSQPAHTIAALRRTIPSYSEEGKLWQELMPLLAGTGASFPAGGMAGATFHDSEFREHDVDVEVWVEVTGEFTAPAPITCQLIPTREVVSTTITGDYSQMPAATAALGAYLAEHRLDPGPMFNIYRVGPAQSPDPATWVTQACFELRT